MELITLKELRVMTKFFMLILMMIGFSFISFELSGQEDRDISLLNTYIKDSNLITQQNILYLSTNNSNELIFDRYEKYLNLKDLKDGLITKTIFSLDEYENYKSQIKKNSSWSIKPDKIETLIFSDSINANTIFISKPVYTENGKYSLIYSLLKGNDKIYFMPSISVYTINAENKWLKVRNIKPRKFN